MSPETKKKIETGILLFVAIVGAVAYSQTFAQDDRIFITDHLFITPKSEPHFFSIFIVLNITLFLLSIFIAHKLVAFLLARGVLFLTGGILLLTGAITLTVVWWFFGHGGGGTTDYIFEEGLLIGFLALLGAAMTFGIPGKRNVRL